MLRAGRSHAPARLLQAGMVALVLAGIGFWAPGARAAGTRLCDGYAACAAAGYPSHGYGAHAETSYWMMSAGDECTNYAAYVEQTLYGVKAPDYVLGDGGVWAQSAAEHGIAIDHTPTVGAVAEWDDGTDGIGGPGHVAVVERVGPYRALDRRLPAAHRRGRRRLRLGAHLRAQFAVGLGAVAEQLHPLQRRADAPAAAGDVRRPDLPDARLVTLGSGA